MEEKAEIMENQEEKKEEIVEKNVESESASNEEKQGLSFFLNHISFALYQIKSNIIKQVRDKIVEVEIKTEKGSVKTHVGNSSPFFFERLLNFSYFFLLKIPQSESAGNLKSLVLEDDKTFYYDNFKLLLEDGTDIDVFPLISDLPPIKEGADNLVLTLQQSSLYQLIFFITVISHILILQLKRPLQRVQCDDPLHEDEGYLL